MTPRPTRRVVLLLVALAVVTVVVHLAPVAAAAVALGIVGAFCVDAFAVRSAEVTFSATLAPAIARGASVPVTVQAHTTARVTRLRQPTPPELALDPPEETGPVLEGSLTGVHRGAHAVPGAVARVTGPFGLATFDRRGNADHVVRVLPDLPRARWLALQRRGASAAEGSSVRRRGIGTEFESIRDYDPNDDVRFVNWMATARCSRPMTNQFRVDENRDLVCLVDAGRLMRAPVTSMTRLDAALDALCVLAAAADDAGDRVGATAFDATVTRHVAPRRRGASGVVEALFDLEPSDVESDFSLAFQQVASRKRSIVTVFTDLVDPAATRQLLDALPILVRRHVVLVASCVDDALAQVTTSRPEGYADVLRANVAIELLDAHREAVRRATAFGAQVIEASPDQLGPACVTAYARVKSRALA